MSQEGEPKEAKGCLWKGCFGLILVGVLLSFAFGWGAYSLYTQMAELTSSKPGSVPEHTADPAAWQAFQARLQAASDKWQAGQPATLEVTSDDLNNMIQLSAEQQEVIGKYYYEIKDGQVLLHVSVPLTWIEGMEGQYFNGLVSMVPQVQDGHFSLEITGLQAGELEAPPQFMQTQKYFDWTAWLEQLGWKENLNLIDALEIQNGKLILRKD